MNIPFVDLQTQYNNLKEEILPSIEHVISRGAFILGEEVDLFEKTFAAYCGTEQCVGVGSGCDALLIAIKACELGPGDEIIAPANTYIATVLAITAAGATPVLVDCLEDSYQIDVQAAEQAITERTRAIIPVHLYGQAADMDALRELAKKHDLKVIEDAAQAHGATYQGQPCGSLGDVGCFSFYPGKNLGAYGDGGAITTSNPAIAERAKMLRNYGQSKKYYHDVAGWNTRLDTVQAAVLNTKLKHLPSWNDARRKHAEAYRQRLEGLPVTLPSTVAGNEHVYHLFVMRTQNREKLMAYLNEKGIASGIHYPIPVHLQKAYSHLDYEKGSFPISERLADEIISLPMFPELNDEKIDYISEHVKGFLTPLSAH